MINIISLKNVTWTEGRRLSKNKNLWAKLSYDLDVLRIYALKFRIDKIMASHLQTIYIYV